MEHDDMQVFSGEDQKKTSENVCSTNITAPPVLLLNMPFQPGECLKKIRCIKDSAERDLAMMQYYYYTCCHEQAMKKAAGYLDFKDLKVRIGALLIYTFSCMAIGDTKEAQKGKEELKKFVDRQADFSRESGIPLLLLAVKMVLHISFTEMEQKEMDEQCNNYDEGGRLLWCYLLGQAAWNNKEWERVIGSVETALHMTQKAYPLIELYFYLSASEAALQLKDIKREERYFQKAWKLAEADGFWAPVGEMRGHLQLFLEKKVRQERRIPYKQIVQATHQYRSGWRKLCCEENPSKEEWKKQNVQETLTGMEYAVAYLAGLGWSNQEIAEYFSISVRTVKYYMTAVFNKLNINCRQRISEFLD